jgi:hypothetical protein
VTTLASVQTIHEGDDIFLINLIEERDVSAGSLPIGNISANELDIRIVNKDRLYDAGNVNSPFRNLVRPNRIIRAWLGCKTNGSIELIKLMMEDLNTRKYSTSGVLIDNTLYDIAKSILDDFGLSEANGEYSIDTELDESEYTVPYAYMENIKHREALRMVVEAAMGQAYIDRDGVLRVEGPSFLDDLTVSQLTIDLDEIYKKNIPSLFETVKNKIIVTTQPFKPVSSKEDVYRAIDGITIPANDTVEVTVFYDQKPVLEAEALLDDPPAGCTVDAATYYAWGAVITLRNTTGIEETVVLYVKGKPLKIIGSQEVIAKDSQSILDDGELIYEFPKNHLVQVKTIAEKIAAKLLASYKDPRRDLTMDWRGNPALELTDRITTYDYRDENTVDFHIIAQELSYDGVLSATLKGRRASA